MVAPNSETGHLALVLLGPSVLSLNWTSPIYPVANIPLNFIPLSSHEWHLYPCPVFNIIYCPINAICPQSQHSYILTQLDRNAHFKCIFQAIFLSGIFIFQCIYIIYSCGNTTAKGSCAALEGSGGPASKGAHMASTWPTTWCPREQHASNMRASMRART